MTKNRRYYLKHREERLRKDRERYWRIREHRLAQQHEYYRRNADVLVQKAKTYRDTNRYARKVARCLGITTAEARQMITN